MGRKNNKKKTPGPAPAGATAGAPAGTAPCCSDKLCPDTLAMAPKTPTTPTAEEVQAPEPVAKAEPCPKIEITGSNTETNTSIPDPVAAVTPAPTVFTAPPAPVEAPTPAPVEAPKAEVAPAPAPAPAPASAPKPGQQGQQGQGGKGRGKNRKGRTKSGSEDAPVVAPVVAPAITPAAAPTPAPAAPAPTPAPEKTLLDDQAMLMQSIKEASKKPSPPPETKPPKKSPSPNPQINPPRKSPSPNPQLMDAMQEASPDFGKEGSPGPGKRNKKSRKGRTKSGSEQSPLVQEAAAPVAVATPEVNLPSPPPVVQKEKSPAPVCAPGPAAAVEAPAKGKSPSPPAPKAAEESTQSKNNKNKGKNKNKAKTPPPPAKDITPPFSKELSPTVRDVAMATPTVPAACLEGMAGELVASSPPQQAGLLSKGKAASPPAAGNNKSRKRPHVKVDEVAMELVATDVSSSKTLGLSWDDVTFNDLDDLCKNSDEHHPSDVPLPVTSAQSKVKDDSDDGIEVVPLGGDVSPSLSDSKVHPIQPATFAPLPTEMTIVDDAPNSVIVENEDEMEGIDFMPFGWEFEAPIEPAAVVSEPSGGGISYADAARKPKEDEAPTTEAMAVQEPGVNAVISSLKEEGEKWAAQLQAEQAEIAHMQNMADKTKPVDTVDDDDDDWLMMMTAPVAAKQEPDNKTVKPKPEEEVVTPAAAPVVASAPAGAPAPMTIARESPPKEIADSWAAEAARMDMVQQASAQEAVFQAKKSKSKSPEKNPAKKPEEISLRPHTQKSPPKPAAAVPAAAEASSAQKALFDSLADSCNKLQQVKSAEECEVKFQEQLARGATPEKDVKEPLALVEDIATEAQSTKSGHRVNIIEIDEVATQTPDKHKVSSPRGKQKQDEQKQKADRDHLKGLLRSEMERRAEAEQKWRKAEHELHQLRGQLATKHRLSINLEAEADHVKGDLGLQSKLVHNLSRHNQEMEQTVEMANIKIAHLEQQQAQGNNVHVGVDVMLDLKLANGRLQDADRRTQLMERDLAEAKVTIKSLEKKNFNLTRQSEDMVTMAVHQEAVLKLEELCHNMEMKYLALEKEYIKMSHLQDVVLTPDTTSQEARLSWPSLSESNPKESFANVTARGKTPDRKTPERQRRNKKPRPKSCCELAPGDEGFLVLTPDTPPAETPPVLSKPPGENDPSSCDVDPMMTGQSRETPKSPQGNPQQGPENDFYQKGT